MKKLPIDVSSFEILRSENYVYVDKTKFLYDLVTAGRLYFLSRPRRFGKSLLISTLKHLFLGNKQYFENLWIEKESDYSWPNHQVIHLDFSVLPLKNSSVLEESLNWELEEIAREHNFDISKAPTPGLKLKALVKFLSSKNRVVILIDEYDYPLVNNINNPKIAQENHAVLRSFYSTMKGLDAHIQTIFVTGVTKFSKTSLFSGLNNLNDISLDPRAATLLGYTKEEILYNFSDHLKALSEKQMLSYNELLEKMAAWYNGYCFSKDAFQVFNPFSVLYCLQKKEFTNYWFESDTPTFLIELLKNNREKLEDIQEIELSSTALGSFEIGDLPLYPILFQAGYLTIADYTHIKENNREIYLYKLKYPNLEVSDSFKKYLLAAFSDISFSQVNYIINELLSALRRADMKTFCSILQQLFAHIPYQLHIAQEKYYHSIFHLLLTILNLQPESEISTNKGRIDLVIPTRTHIFIFEMKLDGSAEKALQQIENRTYYERFLLQKKKIVLIGISFNQNKELLTLDYLIKEL